jgi:diketogulonate reductase-like aldo/keto reductase
MRGGVFEGQWGETLGEIAKKHDASIAQIVIAWGLQRQIVMIPKSVTPARIKENYDAQNIKLSKEEMQQINDLNRGKRVYTDPDNSPWGPYTE